MSSTLPPLAAELESAPGAPAPDPVPQSQLSRLKVESLLLTGVYGLNALVGVAFWAVAAHTVSLRELGESTTVISAFSAAAVVAATGIANAFLAMLPIAGRARGALLRYGYLLAIAASLVTGTIAGVVATVAAPGIGHPLVTVFGIMLISAMWGVFVIQDAVLVALGKARWLLWENPPTSVLKLALLPVLAAGLGDAKHPVVVATALPALAASIIISGVVLPRLTRRAAHKPGEPSADEWMAEHRREFQLFALRDGAASAMNLGLMMFLPFLVTASSGFEEGAVFSLCLQLSTAMDLFTVGVGVSLTATIASDHDAGPAAARAMWKRLARIVACVAVALIAGAPLVLRILGPEFLSRGGWQTIAILAIGSFLRTAFEVWTALLRALRRTRALLGWTSLTSSTLFVGVILGAHLDGAVGGAIGVSSAAVVSGAVGFLGLLGVIGQGGELTPLAQQLRTRWPWLGFEPAPVDGVTETATWFGGDGRQRFGWLTTPADGIAALGVVICSPIGEEARSAHRTLRRLGSDLARAGIVALRVDYDGTGDSAGGQHDPDRIAGWEASIRDAAAELRAMGLPAVAAVGLRMGATLALRQAEAAGFRSLVLWDPCTTGRAFLREGSALQSLAGYHIIPTTPGMVETPGFGFDADTVTAMRTLSLADVTHGQDQGRLLVLTRTGKPIVGGAGAGLRGQHVEWGLADGQETLIGVEPNEARTPIQVLGRIRDWLAVELDDIRPVPISSTVRTQTVLTDPRSGREIRERIVELGPHRLFGIVSEPLDPAPEAAWIGLVNVAVEPHIGPGRRWVDYSRSWAALGLRCVRFDQSGIGDSPPRPGGREDRIFDPAWLRDVPEVVDALQAEHAPVALFGLCSGAYSALEATMRRDIDAVYAVSTVFGSPYFSRGQDAYSPERIVARPFIRPLANLYFLNTKAAFGLWRLYYQVAVRNAPMAAIHGILRRGTTVRTLANTKDAQGFREAIWWSLVRRRAISRTGRFQLRVEPTLEHALMTQWAQDVTYDDATRFWLRRYGVTRDGEE